MKLVIDFESRSPVDIKKCGAYVYANHAMTDVLMLAVLRADEETPKIWIAPKVRHLCPTEIEDQELTELVSEAELLIAHNAPFERWMWEFIMHRRLGFPSIPTSKFFCTMSQSLMCGFPRKLEKAINAIAPDKAKKDMTGHRLMLKLSKPRKFLKDELLKLSERNVLDSMYAMPKVNKAKQLEILARLATGGKPILGDSDFVVYHEKADEYARFVEYCKNDVIPEKIIYNSLPQTNANEREVWILDQEINDRGFKVDIENARRIFDTVQAFDKIRTEDAVEITDAKVTSMKAPGQIVNWLQEKGVDVTSVAKENVADILSLDIPDDVRAFLEIRSELGKSSTAKYSTLLCQSSVDSRCHGSFIYHGATTGRWCLSEGSPTLVKDIYGEIYYKPIETVSLSDLVWDGIEWVSHEGVVFSGVKEVIEHDGIRATPQHKVFISDEKSITLEEAKKRNLLLYTGEKINGL